MPEWNPRVNELFLKVFDRPDPVARRAYLSEQCGGDAELFRAVEVLLNAHDQAGGFLSNPDPAGGTTGTHRGDVDALEPDRPPSDRPGRDESADSVIAGKYQLIEKIGEGGMGSVWVAQQVEPVRRAVAVKLIKAGMDSRAVLARFEAERQALALMDHPNIAKVLDAGATPDGRPFFVMELVKGVPITDFCDARKLTPRERLELFVPVCQAIQHAHQKGIVHRDIKPSNVLVARYDDRAVPKVIDFGVAKAAGQPLTEHTLVTGIGVVIGTPEYMSPEQASFNNLDVDTRSDVYALGVLLYELLAGSPPFSRRELKTAGLLEMFRVIREEEPPRPSTRLSSAAARPNLAAVRGTEPRALERLLLDELDWVAMKALEKDRARRYDTANALAADVQRYLAGEPVQAVPPGRGYRLRKFTRRHRGPVTAGVLLVLALAVGAAGSAWQAVRATRAEAREAAQRGLAEDNETAAVAAAAAEKAARETADRERNAAVTATGVAESEKAKAVEARKGVTEALGRERATSYAFRLALAQREWTANDMIRANQLLDACPADLRGWEWRYVRRLCHSETVEFRGHPTGAGTVVFSPDGKRVASVGSDGVRVWDAVTGKEQLLLKGGLYSRDQTHSATFSPDGKRIAVGRENGVTVYDATDGKEAIRFDTTPNPPTATGGPSAVSRSCTRAIAYSPDGKRIATGGNTGLVGGPHGSPGGVVRVWDASTGKEHPRFTAGLSTVVVDVAFSPDGKHLAAVEAGNGGELPEAGKLWLWDAETGAVRHTLSAYGADDFESLHFLSAVAFTPDSKWAATGGSDGAVRFWDAITGKAGAVFQGPGGSARAVAFSPDGKLLAAGGGDRIVRVWDAAAGKELNSLRGQTGAIGGLAFNRDGTRLASAANDVRLWDPLPGQQSREVLRTSGGSASAVDAVAFNPDSSLLATAGLTGVRFFEAATGRPRPPTKAISPGPMGGYGRVEFSPDGTAVATIGMDGVKLWDRTTGELRRLFPDHPEIAQRPYTLTLALAYSPDGSRIATVGRNLLTVWETGTGAIVHKTVIHPEPLSVGRVAYHPGGTRVATSTTPQPRIPGEVRVWDADTGKELARWPGGGTGLVYDKTGDRLAATQADGTVTVWDANTGKVLVTLLGHTAAVGAVAFSPDGTRLATGGADQTLRVWDAATGDEVLTLRGHGAPVVGVRFSPDGRYLASTNSGSSSQVRLWDAGPAKP